MKDRLQTVSFNVTAENNNKINEYWRKNLYYNKTEFILKAIDNYMEEVECPVCHTRNPKGGRICSVCMHPLTKDDVINVSINVFKKEEGESSA